MRNSSRRNIEQDTRREIGEDVRKIMNGEEPVHEDEGPSLFPGMEDSGIGSVRRPYDGSRESVRDREEGGRTSVRQGNSGRDSARFREEEERAFRKEAMDIRPEDVRRLRPVGRGPYLFISYAFVAIFLLLAGQLIYFNLYQKDEIVNSPYNKRQSSLADHVERGRILSADGEVLAYTESDDEGHETRVYPYGARYAHTVGYVTHGKNGIESAANYQLLSTHMNLIDQVVYDFNGRKSPGDDVVCTLNAALTDAAWNALGDYRGAVIVMDPKTGAIYAMVAKPSFDPNTLAEVWDDMVSDPSNSQLVNRATQGLYPPGSTFKIVTSLAYQRSRGRIEDFLYDCTGSFEVGSTVVHCYKGAVHGEEDFVSAFAHSCNTAFSEIGLQTGAAMLGDTAGKLLIGSELPSDLNVSKSRYSLTAGDGDAELVQTAFGQGKTLVTPYQMALIVSAIANDGVLMRPYLIDRSESLSGAAYNETKPGRYKTLMTPKEAAFLKGLMKAVVEEGSASYLSDAPYEAAGKTGSAEYTKADGSTGTHSWFVGFTGGDEAELVICVLAEDGGAGSSTAVPIAREILDTWYANR